MHSPKNRKRNAAAPGRDLTQFAAEVARKFDVHNIEPHSRHFRSLDSAYVGKFRAELAKANAKVVNIAVSVEESFYDADPVARKKAVASAKTWVDVATSIGSPDTRSARCPSPNPA